VSIDASVDLSALELVNIGDRATLDSHAIVRTERYTSTHIVLAETIIGEDATVCSQAVVDAGAVMGARSVLTPCSLLLSEESIPDDEVWDGVPATRSRHKASEPAPTLDTPWGPCWLGCLELLFTFTIGYLFYLPIALIGWQFPIISTTLSEWSTTGSWYLMLSVLTIPVAAVMGPILTLPCFWIFPKASPGTYARWGLWHWLLTWKASTIEMVGHLWSGTLLWPMWLRWAGVSIGSNTELDTVYNLVPELTTIGSDCFFCDQVWFGAPVVRRGTFTINTTSCGSKCFFGNGAMLQPGSHLPDDCLIGVHTSMNLTDSFTDFAQLGGMEEGTSWVGCPPYQLPRPVTEMDPSLTYNPTCCRKTIRIGFWELGLRPWIPAIPAATATLSLIFFNLVCLDQLELRDAGPVPTMVFLSASTLMFQLLPPMLLFFLKSCLLGKVKPGQHAMYSEFANRWTFTYTAHGFWGGLMDGFSGTAMYNLFLRCFGADVGDWVIFAPGMPGFAITHDHDMLHFEKNAVIQSTFQAHTFEDRVLKLDHVRIGSNCTISQNAHIMYGANIEDNAFVFPNTVVHKNETLLKDEFYCGNPPVALHAIETVEP
jgi:non-ribosomal peptide synthetase-like protein